MGLVDDWMDGMMECWWRHASGEWRRESGVVPIYVSFRDQHSLHMLSFFPLCIAPMMSFAPAPAGGSGRGTGTGTTVPSAIESCSFCSQPAALSVSSSLLSRPYCLAHYYTSRAVRSGTATPDKVHILGPDGEEIFGIEDTESSGGGGREGTEGQSEMARQLPALQELFAEAYTSLRDRIATKLSGTAISSGTGPRASVARRKQNTPGGSGASQRNAHDPLAGLLAGPSPSYSGGSSGKKRGRKRPPSERPARPKPPQPTSKTSVNEANEGGFVRSVPLPGRYVAQQRKMAASEVAERRRLMSAGKAKAPPPGAASALTHVEINPYKRRKPNRTSIWNLAMEGDAGGDRGPSISSTEGGGEGADVAAAKSSWDAIERSMRPTVRCTCGSTDVSNDLNITGRGNDMPKG